MSGMRSRLLRLGLVIGLTAQGLSCTFPADDREFPSLAVMSSDEVLQIIVPATSSTDVLTMEGSTYTGFAARTWREWSDVTEADAFDAFVEVAKKNVQYDQMNCGDSTFASGYKAVDGRNVQVRVSYRDGQVLRIELLGRLDSAEAPPVRLGIVSISDDCDASYQALFEASRLPAD